MQHRPPLRAAPILKPPALPTITARMFFLLSIIRSALSRNCRAKLSRYSAMQRSVLLRRASRVQSILSNNSKSEAEAIKRCLPVGGGQNAFRRSAEAYARGLPPPALRSGPLRAKTEKLPSARCFRPSRLPLPELNIP